MHIHTQPLLMRILIIEDDAELREILRKSLTAESFAVDTADNGETGSYIARTNQYNLIILDYILPGKRGDEVCRELRATGTLCPILIISVESEVPDKVHLLEAGADDYLCKPFSFTELVARIHSLLRRPYEIKEPVLTLDDLTIDTAAQTVSKSGENVYLTRKEYMLLECMARKSGQIISRSQIMEEVWNNDSDPFSNTIEAHIRNLRKKIDGGGRRRYIQTIPGRGYKLDRRK